MNNNISSHYNILKFYFSLVVVYLTLRSFLTFKTSCRLIAWFYLFMDLFICYLFIYLIYRAPNPSCHLCTIYIASVERKTNIAYTKTIELMWNRNKVHQLTLLQSSKHGGIWYVTKERFVKHFKYNINTVMHNFLLLFFSEIFSNLFFI